MPRFSPALLALSCLAAALGLGAPVRATPADRLCETYGGQPAEEGKGPAGMVYVPGGAFTMGSDTRYPEERPPRKVTVGGFWIDRTEVTNAEFAAFVASTGYHTLAERGLDPKKFPEVPAELIVPGSMVFVMPTEPASRMDEVSWWRFTPGADWQHPSGPGSSIEGRANHPVVHIAYEDALAYARWRGRGLPTEAEWEFAARGGLEGADYAWGDEPTQDGKPMANNWQGLFPFEDQASDGHHGTAPVGCYPPNGYGLFDMTGNVWEWASDWYLPGHAGIPNGAYDPQGPGYAEAREAVRGEPLRLIKGGAWLCSDTFCGRYRPAARQPQEPDFGASHVGFRTVLHAPPPEQP